MSEMLTAKDMQDMLHVDRSTIYRMAESGRLPAIKVGRQWRFPADQIDSWFQMGIMAPSSGKEMPPVNNGNSLANLSGPADELVTLLPLECVELIQNSFAELLGVMLVVTDMNGHPITRPSNACGLFEAISEEPQALEKCLESWQAMGQAIELEPKFSRTHLGLLCTRALVRVGHELKGMVVAGCVAPDQWPPSEEEIEGMAQELGVPTQLVESHLEEVYYLSDDQRARVLAYIQRIANIVAHIVNERQVLVGRLAAIANLTAM